MEFQIIRSNRRTMAVEIRQDRLIIRAPQTATEGEINAFMLKNKAWIDRHLVKMQERQQAMVNIQPLSRDELRQLAEQARKYIPERVRYFAPLIGVTCGRITIRNQRTRWGSCSSKGNLNFNCLLMLTPPEVIDSVVVHELCHRKEMNHSKRFYDEVLKVFPDYRSCSRWLKDNGAALLCRMPAPSLFTSANRPSR